MLTEGLLPIFDVSDELALVVDTDIATTWSALLDVDLIEVGGRRPLVGVPGALRALPQIAREMLRGERPAAAPQQLKQRDLTQLPATAGGWILLGERPTEEIALGLVGKFWRTVIEYAEVDATAFKEFAQPGSTRRRSTPWAFAGSRTIERCSGA